MTTKSTRSKPATAPTADDHTLCSVDIKDGIAVYWQDDQRGGTLQDVPKHVALQWLKAGYASAVYEPK